MSIEKNVEVVKNFLCGNRPRAISKVYLRWLPKILSGSFRARAGHWPARTAGTRDWRMCFRRLTKRWKPRTQSPPSS